jgi:hypothetical protein
MLANEHILSIVPTLRIVFAVGAKIIPNEIDKG